MGKPITKEEIVNALYSVGLAKGHTVMVHTALSKMGYVCGGAQAVIEALIEVVGEDFEQSNAVNKAMIGNAELRLMNQKILVDFAVDWIQKYRRG